MLNTIEVTGNKDTRSGFGDGIVEAARKNENIIALTADLLGSMKLNAFIKRLGNSFMKAFSFMEPNKSAVRAIIFSFFLAASTMPSPKPLRVSLLPVTSIVFNILAYNFQGAR